MEHPALVELAAQERDGPGRSRRELLAVVDGVRSGSGETKWEEFDRVFRIVRRRDWTRDCLFDIQCCALTLYCLLST